MAQLKVPPFTKGWWKSKTKGQKTTFILSIIVFLMSIALLLMFIYSRQLFGDTVGDAILGTDVKNGWAAIGNLFKDSGVKWLLSLLVVAIAFVIIFTANLIISFIARHGDRKGKTIASLIRSLLKYLVVIVGICAILVIWGVDVAGIIAGVGVLTLVVGLGCQSLIQDVISGLFIVFDDYFSVGDVVIIDGFRGEIADVGLKSTKIIDYGGNIKSITNSSINTVVNLSRLDSMVLVTISSTYAEDPIRVEGIIAKAMDDIKHAIPAITEGPFYKGISEIGNSSISYLVLCKCKESDRYQVTRDLNKELYVLFRNNNIEIPFNQITVSQLNTNAKLPANDGEIATSRKITAELRGQNKIETPKKRKVFYKPNKE